MENFDHSHQLQATSYTEVARLQTSALGTKGSIVLTSTALGEGCSLVAQLLAQRHAESGKKTLLVDLNLKKPDISETLTKDRLNWNLTDRPKDDKLTDLFIQVEGVSHLYVLPAPLDNTSIQFLNDRTRAEHFMRVLEEQFDYVVVDTSPLEATNRYNADPVILATAAKRCALVLLAKTTAKAKAQRSVRLLREAGARIEGVVVNDKNNPSTKEELLSGIKMLSKIAPGLADWLRYKINHLKELN